MILEAVAVHGSYIGPVYIYMGTRSQIQIRIRVI